MFDKIEFDGAVTQEHRGVNRAQISVRSDHAWIYVQEVDGVVQVWSAPACKVCVRRGKRLERCQLHSGVIVIASQIDLL